MLRTAAATLFSPKSVLLRSSPSLQLVRRTRPVFSVSDSDALREPLTADALAEAKDLLPDWTVETDESSGDAIPRTLKRQYKFSDFAHAFEWMKLVAERADSIDHHPNWSNCYDTVENAVTSLDVTLASFMDEKYAAVQGVPEPAK